MLHGLDADSRGTALRRCVELSGALCSVRRVEVSVQRAAGGRPITMGVVRQLGVGGTGVSSLAMAGA